jgi:hypothetical protein
MIVTTGVHAGDSAAQPAGWGLSAWHAHGAKRNGASSWVAVHSGNHWPMVWDIQPSKRTKGAYTIKTTKYGPADGKQPAGWGLSSWNAHGAKRNHASSRVAVHSGNHWLMDWTIKPSTRTKGAWTIKTTGVHAKTGNQPAGWGLSAWQKHGGKRNGASSWVYTHAGSHWLMDWKLVRVFPKCMLEKNVDYRGSDIKNGQIKNVLSSNACAHLCALNKKCKSFTYGRAQGKWYSKMCFLKHHRSGKRVKMNGVDSGSPCKATRA